MQSATRKDYQRYILYVGEQSLRQMAINGRNLGKAVTQQCAIVDMEGLTMRQLTYKPGKMFNFPKVTIVFENNHWHNYLSFNPSNWQRLVSDEVLTVS